MRRTIAGVVLVLCAVACVCASSLFTIPSRMISA